MAVNNPAAPNAPGPPGQVDAPTADDLAAADAAAQSDTPPTMQQLREMRAENARLRRLYQGARAAETELATLRQAGQTELERATSARTAAEQERESARGEALRLRVALETGLARQRPDGTYDLSLADRLRGANEEELRADAAELARVLPPPTPAAGQPPGRPRVPNAGQNANGQAPSGTSPSDWFREQLQRRG